MPELHRPLGYPMAVFLMIAMGMVLCVQNAGAGSDLPRRRTPSHGFGLGFDLPAPAAHPPFCTDAHVVGTLTTTTPGVNSSRVLNRSALWLCRSCCHQWVTTYSGMNTMITVRGFARRRSLT